MGKLADDYLHTAAVAASTDPKANHFVGPHLAVFNHVYHAYSIFEILATIYLNLFLIAIYITNLRALLYSFSSRGARALSNFFFK